MTATRPAFDVKASAVELVKRTRAAQGLPAQVTDPVALRRVAVLMRVPKPSRRAS